MQQQKTGQPGNRATDNAGGGLAEALWLAEGRRQTSSSSDLEATKADAAVAVAVAIRSRQLLLQLQGQSPQPKVNNEKIYVSQMRFFSGKWEKILATASRI